VAQPDTNAVDKTTAQVTNKAGRLRFEKSAKGDSGQVAAVRPASSTLQARIFELAASSDRIPRDWAAEWPRGFPMSKQRGDAPITHPSR